MKRLAASRKSHAVRLLWVAEVSAIILAGAVAVWVRFRDDPLARAAFYQEAWPRLALIAMLLTASMAAFGLYEVHGRRNRSDFWVRLVLSFLFGSIGLMVLYYLIPTTHIGRGVLAMTLATGVVAVASLHLLAEYLFRVEAFKRRVLVLGAGKCASLITERLRRASDRTSFVLVGFVPVPGQSMSVPETLRIRSDCSLAELTQLLQIDEVVVAPDERRGKLPMEDMLVCAQRGVMVSDLSTFFEREAGMITLSIVDPSWLVFSGGFDHSKVRRLTKRAFDLVSASLVLAVMWPVMLLVAAGIWLESGAPILYRQTRVGESGLPFELVKFRSMRPDAEGDGVARWANLNDDRTTRVGRFIRSTRLDELPQLFNVLRGEMSFVGPRPERPEFVEMLAREIRYYSIRHCMKPGLTGWAQLRYPYGASVLDAEEKLKFDLFYVKNHGLVFDLMILLQTVDAVLFRRGSR